MIIVERGNWSQPKCRILRQMFEARKAVFVDLLKWDLPVLEGRFELDQFDNEDALYIVIADENGGHLGSARLLPTTRAHILGSLFPQLCADALPSGSDTFEITRFCLGRNQGAARRRETRDRLVSALVLYALENRIGTYTAVADMRWLQQILAFGWDCRPLGPPLSLASGLTGALAITVDHETPALLERNGMWVPERLERAELAQAA